MKSKLRRLDFLHSLSQMVMRTIPHFFAGLPLLLLSNCREPDIQDPRLLAPKVQVTRVQEGSTSTKVYTGTVEARFQSDLGFRVSGKILERLVSEGQKVRKGDILLRLDPKDFDLSLAAQQSNVEVAKARFIQAKAEEARHAQLLISSAVSRQEYERTREARDSAAAQLEAAKALAKVSENSSQYAILEADSDGVVVRTLGEPGQVVGAGQPVIQLAHEGPREASVNLPEGQRPLPGSKATARLYGKPKSYPAVLRQLSDAADPRSRTFEARYVLQDEASTASIGSTVTVTINDDSDTSRNAMTIPVGSVYDRGQGPGVWLVTDGNEVRFKSVELVSIGNEEVVVKGNISKDDVVVALGAHLLHEGQNIRISNGGTDKR